MLDSKDHSWQFSMKKTPNRSQRHNTFVIPLQYWLGITMSKSTLRLIHNASNGFMNLIFYLVEVYLID